MAADKPQPQRPKAKPTHPWRAFNPGWLQSNPALPDRIAPRHSRLVRR